MNIKNFDPGRFRPDPKPEKTEKKKQKPINKVSKRRQEESKQYNVLKKLFLEGKKCAVDGCGKATEVHHTFSGKDRQKYFLDISTWLPVARKCHIWIHENSKEARLKGLLK